MSLSLPLPLALSAVPGRCTLSLSADAAGMLAVMTRPTPATPQIGQPPRRLGAATATLIVIASMIGTGVFTTTGFLVRDIPSSPAVLLAWLVGGLLALCGALAYGELVAALPRNGGEYQILARVYHPAVGFVAGWISLVVGFSAPIAASAIGFGSYLAAIVPAVNPTAAAAILVVGLSALHAAHVTAGSGLQNAFTIGKVLLIAGFVGGGLVVADPARVFASGTMPVADAVISPQFAVGLILVAFAYSGWNGAAYIAGEVRRPDRVLPLALFLGTGVVVLLYLGLNVVFLASAPPEELAGVVEVGHVAATRLFGPGTGAAVSAVIALALVSSVSAQVMAGPRVYEAMGVDYRRLAVLARRSDRGGPVGAVVLQGTIALAMLLTSTFEALLTFIGFTLSLASGLAVVGVIVLRRREPDLRRPYRTWGYPVTPLLFVALSAWMVVHAITERPVVAAAGGLTIVSGLVVHALVARGSR